MVDDIPSQNLEEERERKRERGRRDGERDHDCIYLSVLHVVLKKISYSQYYGLQQLINLVTFYTIQ